jgi:hypothetical protein
MFRKSEGKYEKVAKYNQFQTVMCPSSFYVRNKLSTFRYYDVLTVYYFHIYFYNDFGIVEEITRNKIYSPEGFRRL